MARTLEVLHVSEVHTQWTVGQWPEGIQTFAGAGDFIPAGRQGWGRVLVEDSVNKEREERGGELELRFARNSEQYK